MNLCLNCHSRTNNVKFCCRSCSATYNNCLYVKRKRIEKRCTKCNEKITGKSHGRKRICDSCTQKVIFEKQQIGKMTLSDIEKRYELSGRSPSYKHAFVRNHCHSVNKHRLRMCQVCGYSKHVELCHIKPISKFDMMSTLNEINNVDNIAILCPNHHWELDAGLITISDFNLRV